MNKKLKGTAASNISYTGIVKLSQYTRGKKLAVAEIHNAGGKPLFDFLADCLIGDFELAKLSCPSQILLLNCDKDEDGNIVAIEQAANTSPIGVYTKPEKVYSETEGIVRYSFMIPQEYFAAGNIHGATRFNAIGLYSNPIYDVRDFAAFCEVNTSSWSISISSVLVLDWELHIANVTTDTER